MRARHSCPLCLATAAPPPGFLGGPWASDWGRRREQVRPGPLCTWSGDVRDQVPSGQKRTGPRDRGPTGRALGSLLAGSLLRAQRCPWDGHETGARTPWSQWVVPPGDHGSPAHGASTCPPSTPSTIVSAWAEWGLWVGATASRGVATAVLSVADALLQGGRLWALTGLPVPR